MDYPHSITDAEKRKKGKHLTDIDRGTIQALNREGMSLRKIAGHIGCSPSTILNELRRGTPPRKSNRGRAPGYSAKHGAAVYRANRKRSKRPHKVCNCAEFLGWTHRQVKEENWSLDVCVGYARLHNLFPASEMICTSTLYNEVWAGGLSLTVMDLPEALKRKHHKHKGRKNKRVYGASISERPEIAGLLEEEGHWEGDTVVGKRNGKEAVVFTLLEKKTRHYIAIKIPGKTAEAVLCAMTELQVEFGDKFSQVFKTITVDNGSEFADFAKVETWGTKVFFAHPYSSWERPQNERHNGIFRTFVPKGASIENFTAEEILMAADQMNSLPRKALGYLAPEDLFESFLDRVFAA